MTQEQIENAATESLLKDPIELRETSVGTFQQGFILGAKWRIESVWHKPEEKPEESEAILTLNERNSPTLYQRGYLGDWSFIAKTYHIVRWAYINDLLPEE